MLFKYISKVQYLASDRLLVVKYDNIERGTLQWLFCDKRHLSDEMLPAKTQIITHSLLTYIAIYIT